MELPKFMPKSRNREFNLYSKLLRSRVVYMYLFEGKSHRWLDEMILGKDPKISKGFQSMGILHHIGLVNVHKNLFKGFTIQQALEHVKGKSEVYVTLLESLENDSNEGNNEDYEYEVQGNNFQGKIDQKIAELKVDYTINGVEEYLPREPKPKVKNNEGTHSYPRSVYEATRALMNAEFKCEMSENHCSFISKKTGENYVEAHHLIPISFQEDFQYDIDQVPNLVALCPNCHKKIHLSTTREKEIMLKELYLKKSSDLKKIGISVSEEALLKMYGI